jgi:hypothetical protein
MYIFSPRGQRNKDRGRSSRYRSKLKAKCRRRKNRMGGRRLSAK